MSLSDSSQPDCCSFLSVRRALSAGILAGFDRDCPQELGSDPGPFLRTARLDSRGRMSVRDAAELHALATTKPIIFLVHGSYVSESRAIADGLRMRDDLETAGAITDDAAVVVFDWPCELERANFIRDANDKARLSFVAAYHLARFLQGFPSESRISMIGHSHGGLIIMGVLHLLAGGTLDNGEEATVLSAAGPNLRMRAVVIASASARHWLDPGERFGMALAACEGFLCLYNPLDPVLAVHPFGRYSERRRALGRSGMSRREQERLGSLAGRYRERSIARQLGLRHTFRGTTASPVIAGWMQSYTWADSG